MKNLCKKLLSALLVLGMLLSLIPVVPMQANAGGIFVDGLLSVVAGQEATIETQGLTYYQTTNMIFQCSGNTIATIEGYDASGEKIMDSYVCDDDYLEFSYNALGGYRYEVKVFYGQIDVSYNTANQGFEGGDPIASVYEFGDKLEWLVKPTINEVYLTVGDTAMLNVSEVADGFSARAEAYEDEDFSIAKVNDDGTITARSPGTANVYMKVLFWRTSTQYFYFWVPCVVHVVEDYTMDAYRDYYYAEPDQSYFNIVAYRPDGMRDIGFDVTVGDETYNTGSRTNVLVDMPADYEGDVTISKEGYVPYVLKNEHLEVNNVITMTRAEGSDPVIHAVWIRPEDTEDFVNAKYQTIQVLAGKSTMYDISYDAFWNDHNCSAVYLQQGSVTLPLSPEGDKVALGEFFTADGGPVTLHALTTDGYVISVPLLINVAAEVTIMSMDFGDPVGTNVDSSVTGLGGQKVAYDLLSTVPVKFAIAPDGSVRGIIGVKFNGPKTSDNDLYDLYDEINQDIKLMEEAEKKGDKETAKSLMKELEYDIADRDAYLNPQSVTFGFSSDVSFLGYFDGTMTAEGFDVTEVGMIGVFHVAGTGYQNFYISGIPAQWRLTFEDKLELMIGGLADGSNGKLSFKVPQFTNTISATGALSVGAPGVADISATLKGNFVFDYPREADSFADGTWSMNASFNLAANVLCVNLDVLDWDSINGLRIWPESAQDGNSISGNLMPASTAVQSNARGLNISDAVEKAVEEAQAFRSGIGEDSVPQLVRLENMDVLVWIEDATGRDQADAPCLYYAVRSHDTDTWSDAAPVYDNGTADYNPKLTLVGEQLYLTWQKAAGSLAGLTEAGDILQSRDIYTAQFDAASGSFQGAEIVHDPDESMDLLPQIRENNGEREVVWIRVSGDPTDIQAESTVFRSVYSGEDGWMARPVAQLPGVPDSLAVSEDGSIYYTLNGMLYTLQDDEAVAMTSEEAYARAVKFSQGSIYWLEDNCVTDGTLRIPASWEASDFALHTSPDGNKKVLVYYASNDNGRQLFAVYGEKGGWGEPVAIMDASDAWLSGVTGYYDNSGKLSVAVNRLRTYNSGAKVAYLRLITKEPQQNLALTGVEYLGTSLTEGGNLLTTVFVDNTGSRLAENVSIQILQGEEMLLNKAVEMRLMPGQSGTASLIIPMEMATLEDLTVKVLPIGGTDADPTDNTEELVLNLGDISAEYMALDTQPDGSVLLSAMLINRGMTDLENIRVVFTKGTPDGEILGTLDAGNAARGEVLAVDADFTGLAEGDLVYMTAQLDEVENYISNNTTFARVSPMIQETAIVHSGDDIQGQQLELDTDYSFVLEYDDQTGDAETFTGIFTPEESGFYLTRLRGFDERYADYDDFYARVETVEGAYIQQHLVEHSQTEMPAGGWEATRSDIAYLEAGTDYSIQVSGNNDGAMVTLRLEKAPVVTELQTLDHTMYLGEELNIVFGDVYDLGLVTFLPELSRDVLTFTSSNENVAVVDEYGDIHTRGIGTTVITAKGQVYGHESSFTITVVEPECAEPLVLGDNFVEVEWDDDMTIRAFTAPETGYYRFAGELGSFHVYHNGEFSYVSSARAIFLNAGQEYPCYFSWQDTISISKVETRGDIALEEDAFCEGEDCQNVMLYRYVPQEDHLLYIWFRGGESELKIYDAQFQLVSSTKSSGGYWYSSGSAEIPVEKGKTYYIAVEHTDEASLYLSKITMELYYYGAVFVGETVELSPDLSNGSEDDYTFTWSSSDPSVATVDQTGTVQFLKEGDVTITVTAADGMLRASKSFYAIKPKEIVLNQELKTTLDAQRISAVRLVFTAENQGDYVFRIRYQEPGDVYWMYEYELTDLEGEYLEPIHSEYIRGEGNNTTLHLSAGETCVLTLYYEADTDEEMPIDLTFQVSLLDCGTNGHTFGPGIGWDPGCEYEGMTEGEHCVVCGFVRVEQEEIPALGHDFVDGVCTRCGEAESDVIRLAGANRYATAIMAADEMKAALGAEKFDAIIIASGNDFADALAGSYLATVKNAPILLSYGGTSEKYAYLDTDNIDYVKNNLVEGGTVYILGGKNAVPELYETGLEGINVKRLGGANRFETNILILEEAGIENGAEVLVCTATNFADSLSASATGMPILLVWNARTELYGNQPEFLAGLKEKGCTFTILGGENAVSAKLADAVAAYGDVDRLAGKNRMETSVLVAEKYFDAPETAVVAYAWNYPDGLCGGSLAYSLGAPLILTMPKYEKAAVDYAAENEITTGYVLGGEKLVTDEIVRSIFAMYAESEIIVKN